MVRAKELTLEDIRENIAQIKDDIARKEGERTAQLNILKTEYGIKSLDEGYKTLSKLEKTIQDKQKAKSELMRSIINKLQEFGYA